MSWTHKNKNVGRPFLEHTLAIADMAVALKVAEQIHDGLDVIDGDELISNFPDQTQAMAKPYHMNVPIIHKGGRFPVGVEPDYAFSLYASFPKSVKRFSDKNDAHQKVTKAKRRAHFMVEVDRDTMPVERFDLRQTSILRKLLAYQTLWKSKLHQQHFGWKNFRVLFVTTSKERAQNMIASLNGHGQTQHSPLFLFADKDYLFENDDLFSRNWLDCYGNQQKLLPGKWK